MLLEIHFKKKKKKKTWVQNHKSKGTKKRNNDVFWGHSRELSPNRKHVGGVWALFKAWCTMLIFKPRTYPLCTWGTQGSQGLTACPNPITQGRGGLGPEHHHVCLASSPSCYVQPRNTRSQWLTGGINNSWWRRCAVLYTYWYMTHGCFCF